MRPGISSRSLFLPVALALSCARPQEIPEIIPVEPAPLKTPAPPSEEAAPAAAPRPTCPSLPAAERGLAPWDTKEKLLCIEAPSGTLRQMDAKIIARFDPHGKELWRFALPQRLRDLALGASGDFFVLSFQNLQRFSDTGALLWQIDYEDGHKCGFPTGMAVNYSDEILLSCAYSLLKFDGSGAFLWQKWPVGDEYLSVPLVDKKGQLFLSGGGLLMMLGPDGEKIWDFYAGFNRHIHSLALTLTGQLAFQTSQAARHAPTVNGVRRYYLRKPPEILVVDRSGKEISRRELPPGGVDPSFWPEVVPLPRDGSQRIP